MRLNPILPPEATSNESRLIISGCRQLLIEGHKGLISYDAQCITLRLQQGTLICRGDKLSIALFSADDMVITGSLSALEMAR